MTAITVAGPATQARVVRSEWTKFRSLRSSWWTVAVAVLLTVGLGVLLTFAAASETGSSEVPRDVAARSEIGAIFAQLTLGVLAILLICGEYGTGMIRASMAVVPRRLPVLWGKIAVYVGVVLPLTMVTSFAAFLLGQLAWRAKGRPAVSLADPDVLRIITGAALYLTVAGILALAIGAIIRNTAASITVLATLFFVLPTVLQAMPAGVAEAGRYLPSNAGGALGGIAIVNHPLAPWPGFALLCGYTAVAVVVAVRRLRQTDV